MTRFRLTPVDVPSAKRCTVVGVMCVMACALIVPTRVPGQAVPGFRMQFDQHFDRQYLFANKPNGETRTIFEAQLAPQLSIWNNLNASYDNALGKPRAWHRGSGLRFTMLTRLRMTTESSSPVRTPSYMPKLTYQLFMVRRASESVTKESLDAHGVTSLAADLTVGHYSNGQDGCLFANQRRAANRKDCEMDPSVPAAPLTTNRRDGSFSMHYLEAGVYKRAISLNTTTLEPAEAGVASDGYWSAGIRTRYHVPERWLGGGMSQELRDVYGGWRINATADKVWWRDKGFHGLGPGHLRLEAFVEALPGMSDAVPPVRFSVELSRSYYKHDGWGSFIRYYYGQDYYNLGFLTQLSVVQFGAMIDRDRLPSFRMPGLGRP